MFKNRLIALIVFFASGIASYAQDTIVVKTLNYNSTTRDTTIDFPDGTDSYEKIWMRYSMRCKNGLVSDGTDRNKGCGEWDYSCNTYIEDPSKTDSLLAYTNDYSISNFSGTTFNYSNTPAYDYYRNTLQKVTVNATTSSNTVTIGSGTVALPYIIASSNDISSGFSGKSQYLYTAAELQAAGLTAGAINALSLSATNNSAMTNLQIRISSTAKVLLTTENIDNSGFTSVFYDDVNFAQGDNELHFHTPYTWDGTSNLLIEVSLNGAVAQAVNIETELTTDEKMLYAYAGNSLYLDGTAYIEADSYEGILGTAERTIDAWIRTNQVNGEICSWGNDAAGQKWVFRVNGDGTLRTEVNGGGVNGTTIINDNQWHHVACVFSGNSVAGIKHYVDGILETNGTVTASTVNTAKGLNVRISRGVNNRYFKGDIDGVRIWSAALTAAEIAQVKNKQIDASDARIKLNYSFDDKNINTVTCSAQTPQNGKLFGNSAYRSFRAVSIFKDFQTSKNRPNIKLVQGIFNISTTSEVSFDSVPQLAHNVIKYDISSNTNTNLDDTRVEIENTFKWNADNKQYFYDEQNMLYDSASVSATGSITPKQIPYVRRWASRLEIMSFVTPYGIGLDLGPEGKTWTFDVTDFTPILKGNKRMFLSRGGENQEQMDIQFLFIKGTPAREVLDISQLWPTQQYSANYTQILANDVYFPPINYKTIDSAKGFKIRSAITGHGQEGEFIPRNHFIKVNNETFSRLVWKTCGDNPVYPQGGTWIYDRAGWCPGMATDLAEYDLTGKINGGDIATLDYGLDAGSGDSRYIVNNQLVSYGDYNFGYDLSIEDVLEPSNKIEHGRNNPTCLSPKITVRNNGKNVVNSITIDYWVNNRANKRTYTWNCYLTTGQLETIYLPQDNSIYSSAVQENSIFYAEITAIDGNTAADEYANNNLFASNFDFPEVYPQNFFLFYRTNSAASETKIKVVDEWNKIVFEKNTLANNTLYRDTLLLGLGCYKLTVEDTDGDGLSFFANADGSGFFRLWEVGGTSLKTLNPDFGNKTELSFTVVHKLDVPKRSLDLGYKLYPNPSSGLFSISGGDMAGALHQVFNTYGQIIEPPYTQDDAQLNYDLSAYPSGVYFVKISKNGYTWTSKVIVE